MRWTKWENAEGLDVVERPLSDVMSLTDVNGESVVLSCCGLEHLYFQWIDHTLTISSFRIVCKNCDRMGSMLERNRKIWKMVQEMWFGDKTSIREKILSSWQTGLKKI